MVHSEFQAVILAAGRGSRMTELTSGMPKCLLPVGEKPVLCRSIDVLLSAGFKDVIIIVLENELSEIRQSLVHHHVKIDYELYPIPPDCEDWGTADSLRYLLSQEKIKKDIFLMSCDLFTNVNVNKLLEVYHKHSATFAAFFFLPVLGDPVNVPGMKSKYKAEKDIVGVDLDTNRLLFLASASDFEETISINQNLLRRHPRFNLRTDLTDGHIYVLSKKLMEYLLLKNGHSTLKGEFLPHVVSRQHIRKIIKEDGFNSDELVKKTLLDFMENTEIEKNIMKWSPYNDHDGDIKEAYHGDVVRCYAVHGNENDFGIRVNCLQSLWQANWLCTNSLDMVKGLIGVQVCPLAKVETNQIDQGSFIGSNSNIKPKTSIKASVIGMNCIVHSKTRISNCIFIKNVEVQEGCVLENCIVANDVHIGSGCEIRNCLIGSNYRVSNGTKADRQILIKSEGLMEI